MFLLRFISARPKSTATSTNYFTSREVLPLVIPFGVLVFISLGRVKQKHAALAALVAFPKPYKFSRDQKMRGFVVDKDFKARAWNQDEIRIPTLGGKVLRLPGYAACNLPLYHVTNTLAPPLKRQFPHDPPCREIPGLDPRYLVSTITKPIVRPGPVAPAPMPVAPMKTPISNHLLPVTPSKSSKERMSCTVPNCGKDFADRSSLNRHKKRMHPELTNSRSNLSRA